MENENKPVKENTEKKNIRRGHHGKSNKSRGYFITPADPQAPKKDSGAQKKETSAPAQKPQATAPVAPKAENGEGKSSSGNRNNRRRRRGRGHGNQNAQKPKDAAQVQKQQEREVSNPPQKETADTQSRQKSRHGGRPTPSYPSLTLREHLDDPSEVLVKEMEEEEVIDPSMISPDVLEAPPSMPVVDDTVPRVEVVGIRFKSTGKVYYFAPAGKTYARGSYAIVETARGLEYGEIAMGNTTVKETDIVPPLRPILREATKADHARHEENKKKEAEALVVCAKKIEEHKLDMKLIEAQYTFDNSKLLFYFTSAGRVDFRDLVKDLASVFRTRIELRQIGIRDEAKMMGGLGLCGRPLCCSVFLSDFCQVSIKMAKEQNFSLNSSKISGMCGRLMCCLRFEHETYEYEIKRTPPVDALVQTPDGNGVVIENSPLVGTVKVRLLVTPEVAPKVYHRDDVVVLQRKQSHADNEKNDGNEKNKSKR